jgi:hypothetical protein
MQYYEQMFSLLRSPCKNVIFRQASTAGSVRESPWKVHIQYYEPMFTKSFISKENTVAEVFLVHLNRHVALKSHQDAGHKT